MSPEEETNVVMEKPKRAPRKRVPKEVSEDAPKVSAVSRTPKPTSPRRRTTKSEEAPAQQPARKEQRKAPTPIAAERATRKKSRRQGMVVAILLLIGIGASAAVGMTDKGGINVNEVIENRNERIRRGEIQDVIIPVQNTNQEPDGGLLQLPREEVEKSEAAERAKKEAANAASTTAPTASTTPEGNVPLSNEEAAAVAAAAESQ